MDLDVVSVHSLSSQPSLHRGGEREASFASTGAGLSASTTSAILGNADLYSYRPTDALVDEDLAKFRELLAAKRDLKRTLKKFDADFVETHGRQPKKADKESMRPMYQKYQEVRGFVVIPVDLVSCLMTICLLRFRSRHRLRFFVYIFRTMKYSCQRMSGLRSRAVYLALLIPLP